MRRAANHAVLLRARQESFQAFKPIFLAQRHCCLWIVEGTPAILRALNPLNGLPGMSYKCRSGGTIVLTRSVLCVLHPPRVEQGTLTFEKDATFVRCFNEQVRGEAESIGGEEVYDASSGGGGAVYHHTKGAMHFMGKLTMTDNEAYGNVSVLRACEGRTRRSGHRGI